MSMKICMYLFLCLSVLVPAAGHADPKGAGKAVLFRENFDDLSAWKPLHFPKIKRHTAYGIEKSGGLSYLRADSNSSASALVHGTRFNVYDFPRLRWRWKVNAVFEKGDAEKKSGDDYPIRIYAMFEYDPDSAGFWEKVKYNAARLIYGEYPPHSSLNYIWGNKVHSRTIIANRYTDRAMMFLVETGPEHAGMWREYDVNLVDDYVKAFGKKPPPNARIAVMSDSDNTGEHSVSFVDYIEIYGEKPENE